MTDFLELAAPFEFIVPDKRIVQLTGLNQDVNSCEPRNLYQAQFALMEGIVATVETILLTQVPELKKQLQIGKETVTVPPNCSDSAAAILHVCSTMSIPAYAHFNGAHASVKAPNPSGGYWALDRLNADHRTEKHGSYKQSIHDLTVGMGDHNVGISWRTMEDDEDDIVVSQAYYEEQNIRQLTGEIRQGSTTVGCLEVLVSAPLAFTMLRAIDLLEAFRANQLTPHASRDYSAAKQALKHLVPKL